MTWPKNRSQPALRRRRLHPPSGRNAAASRPDAISCPGCARKYGRNSKICTNCGIDLKTGRAILVSSDVDENALHVYAEQILYVLSFFIRVGLYPLASEGFGSKRPYSIWGIAVLTILITVVVWGSELSSGPQATKNLMLWAGREPTAADVQLGYVINPITRWGDSEAMDKKLGTSGERLAVDGDDEDSVQINKPHEKISDAQWMKAYDELEPEQQFYGQFHYYQLFTNGFLQGGILHLAGNLLFLMVFGSRVNALLGQWKTVAALSRATFPRVSHVSDFGDGSRSAPGDRRIRGDHGIGRDVLYPFPASTRSYGRLDSLAACSPGSD